MLRSSIRTATVLFPVAAMALALVAQGEARGQTGELKDLPRLDVGRVRAENALWIENPLSSRFNTSKRVVVADLKGPAEITMMHFALPQSEVSAPLQRLNRDLLLMMSWDGEATPSVAVPLVDFFCDPAGLHDEIRTELVNKRRGFNAYFPMPFRKSARIELVYDGPITPGEALWRIMPCYSYVMYRTLEQVPEQTGYFHAAWRQESLRLGEREYLAIEARGRGKFVGWNTTVRLPGREGYPVDQNEKFFVDGESKASVEFQGMEDSFGFSWGFPPTESQFPLTGFFPYDKGAAAYRFFLRDAISFQDSLRVTIGFGEHEDPSFRHQFSQPGSELQFSSTVYWYQTEPHRPLPPLPAAAERAPAPDLAFWPRVEKLPATEALRKRNVKLHMLCGRPGGEVIFAEPGFSALVKQGQSWAGWMTPVYYCRSSQDCADDSVEIALSVPGRSAGTVRLFLIDPDQFQGGRRQSVQIASKPLGVVHDFTEGRWLEQAVSATDTVDGRVLIRAHNEHPGSNAVISIVEWVGSSR